MLRRDAQSLHFRRQHAVGPYILDFYCAAAKLCVEIDGPMHDETADYDEQRTRWLNGQGVRVIRFTVAELEERPAPVIAAIVRAAAPSTSFAGPPPATRERVLTAGIVPLAKKS